MEETQSCLSEEIEVLEAIYIHELEVKRNERGDVEKIILQLHPATGDDVEQQFVCMTLLLDLPKTYPEEPPDIAIRNPRGIGEEEVQSLLEDMHIRSWERTGGAMLFELIELAKDSLTSGNIPHCPCMICLEHFSEGDSFTKTECYHYFHQACLSRYIKHALSTQPAVEESYTRHTKVQEKKLMCPVCREEIQDRSDELLEGNEDEAFHFTPSQELLKMQASMADLLEKQRAKGGVIDVEAEKNKYLVKKDDVVLLASPASDANLLGKDESLDQSSSREKTDRPRSGNDSRYRNSGRGRSERNDREKDRKRTGFDREKERTSSGYIRGKGRGKRFNDNHYSDDEVRHRDVRNKGKYDERRDKRHADDRAGNRRKHEDSDRHKQENRNFERPADKTRNKTDVTYTETDVKKENHVCDKIEPENMDDQGSDKSKALDERKEKTNESIKNDQFVSRQDKHIKDMNSDGANRKYDRYDRFRKGNWHSRNDDRNRPESGQSDKGSYKSEYRERGHKDRNYITYRNDPKQPERHYHRHDYRKGSPRDGNYDFRKERGESSTSQKYPRRDEKNVPKESHKEAEVTSRGKVSGSDQDVDKVSATLDKNDSDRKGEVINDKPIENKKTAISDVTSSGKRYGRGRGRGRPRAKEIGEKGYHDTAKIKSPREKKVDDVTKGVQDIELNGCDKSEKSESAKMGGSGFSHKGVSISDNDTVNEKQTNKSEGDRGPPGFRVKPPPGFMNSKLPKTITPPPGF